MVIAQPIGTMSSKETCVSETVDNNNIIKKQFMKIPELKESDSVGLYKSFIFWFVDINKKSSIV